MMKTLVLMGILLFCQCMSVPAASVTMKQSSTQLTNTSPTPAAATTPKPALNQTTPKSTPVNQALPTDIKNLNVQIPDVASNQNLGSATTPGPVSVIKKEVTQDPPGSGNAKTISGSVSVVAVMSCLPLVYTFTR